SFGDTLLKRLGVITAHPDVLRIDLDSKPLKFLIVGTDGFWDVVSSEEAVNFAIDYLRSHDRRDWHRNFYISRANCPSSSYTRQRFRSVHQTVIVRFPQRDERYSGLGLYYFSCCLALYAI
ncbi:hypothetical protein OSTOST_00053, partial [Ostertagia ostertagi]